ncbi:Ldh family oxidoreductase [Polaromonas sp.]|uniref:Ldh family oxidoreductase n=1 Tax=Polaromonas sp. TaxID=1869339 RepID=UPI003263BE25
MADTIALSLSEVHQLALRVLTHHGLSGTHAEAIARVIVAGERDECHSHGVFRLLMCTRSLQDGKVSCHAEPKVTDRSAAIVVVDAQFGFSQLAFEIGSQHLALKARRTGIAALVINNCFHFSALWPEVESLAEQGLAALAMTPSHAWVAPAGGSRPVFGTNPMAFAWPRPGGHPYVFDFATSAVARGEIDLYRRSGRAIPPGWGIDATGAPSTDAATVLQHGAMLTFGGHKGSALSTMIELLAGPLIGDLTSMESKALDGDAGGTPCHGELILAFDPTFFSQGDARADQARAEQLFQAITDQGARLPSQRRFEARARSLAQGVRIPRALRDDVLALLR